MKQKQNRWKYGGLCFILVIIMCLASGCENPHSDEKNLGTPEAAKYNRTYTDNFKMQEIVEEYNVAKEGQKYSYLKYKLDHNAREAVILKLKISSSLDSITVPAVLEGYPVIRIGSDDESTESNDQIVLDDSQKASTLKIPEGIKTIGEWAFHGEKIKFREVFLPQSVEEIGDGAFADSRVRIIHVQNKATDFGANCFSSSCLEKIELPDGYCGTFGMSCFDHTRIQNITWPAGDNEQTHKVVYAAFKGCKKLIDVKFQNNQKQIFIPEYCFYGCSKLKKLVFPSDTGKVISGFTPYAENNRKAAPGTFVIRGKNTVIESTCTRKGKNLFGAEWICTPKNSKAWKIAEKSLRIRRLSEKMIRFTDQNDVWKPGDTWPKSGQAEYSKMKRKELVTSQKVRGFPLKR